MWSTREGTLTGVSVKVGEHGMGRTFTDVDFSVTRDEVGDPVSV